ncbi:transmembrane protein 255B isoform X3 [Mustela erminea]|uniref:transmembrane protein 255B isoform X3 n=1 Tax=Mustela erminea TaxID=36723 RepID=UPI0013868C62|nr:transmembrane protein 255B isoform X3 [Mustela erminea]
MQPPAPGPLALLDTTEGFARRKKDALWFVGSLLVVSAAILTVGLAATTRTENVTVGGYYPGVILGFGAFLGITGLNLVENRRQMLVAAIVFVSFGVVAAFCCALVDGVFAARHIEPRPLTAGRCQFFASEVGYVPDAHQTEVTCHSSSGACPLKVKSSSCYCCELYRCQSTEHPPIYYEFVGVRSCQDALHLYRLLWASAVLNVLGALLGVLTAAVLGAFKDMVPLSQLAYGPSAPPQTLYDPAQQILAYAGFCPAPVALPTCSTYPLPLQVGPASPRGSRGAPIMGGSRPQQPWSDGTRMGAQGGKRGPTASPPPVWLQGSRARGLGTTEGHVADISRPLHIPGLCCLWPWCVLLSRPGAFSDPGLGPSEVRLGGPAGSLGPVSCSSGETAELALSHALPTAAATS